MGLSKAETASRPAHSPAMDHRRIEAHIHQGAEPQHIGSIGQRTISHKCHIGVEIFVIFRTVGIGS